MNFQSIISKLVLISLMDLMGISLRKIILKTFGVFITFSFIIYAISIELNFRCFKLLWSCLGFLERNYLSISIQTLILFTKCKSFITLHLSTLCYQIGLTFLLKLINVRFQQ